MIPANAFHSSSTCIAASSQIHVALAVAEIRQTLRKRLSTAHVGIAAAIDVDIAAAILIAATPTEMPYLVLEVNNSDMRVFPSF